MIRLLFFNFYVESLQRKRVNKKRKKKLYNLEENKIYFKFTML